LHAITSHGGDDPRRGIDQPNAVIRDFGDEDTVTGTSEYGGWRIQTRIRSKAAVAAEALHAVPRHRFDGPCRGVD
jgi:hypothetical protein